MRGTAAAAQLEACWLSYQAALGVKAAVMQTASARHAYYRVAVFVGDGGADRLGKATPVVAACMGEWRSVKVA